MNNETAFLAHWASVSRDYGFGAEFNLAYRAARAAWVAAELEARTPAVTSNEALWDAIGAFCDTHFDYMVATPSQIKGAVAANKSLYQAHEKARANLTAIIGKRGEFIPAAPVVAEGLRYALDRLRVVLQFATPSIDKIHEFGPDGCRTDGQHDKAFPHPRTKLAAHPVAGSPAEAEPDALDKMMAGLSAEDRAECEKARAELLAMPLERVVNMVRGAAEPIPAGWSTGTAAWDTSTFTAAAEPMPAAERSNLERERDLALSAARHEAENADMWRKRALGLEPMPASECEHDWPEADEQTDINGYCTKCNLSFQRYIHG